MSIDDQIPTHLEPGFLHGDVFLVEFSQAAQEVPQHWRIDEDYPVESLRDAASLAAP